MRVTLKAHQSKKGKEWRIGYKAHIGVDAAGGLVHGVETKRLECIRHILWHTHS
ncbi:hypothetical protein [Atopobium sp. oral taxon 416]|uniref:hypothetical protein n=1 Tax=Atopobium sp. oral taxon 416 TaxID=712157 RepID=UPI001BA831FD|nr:hypothetical protein [Atopobium sp. oral taxon 416]QUC04060.1 hypothetical protein J4859_03720 [Atopobium sp. oral taxon 416]